MFSQFCPILSPFGPLCYINILYVYRIKTQTVYSRIPTNLKFILHFHNCKYISNMYIVIGFKYNIVYQCACPSLPEQAKQLRIICALFKLHPLH